jgi:tetratricopeptide (TPR) repeat protein
MNQSEQKQDILLDLPIEVHLAATAFSVTPRPLFNISNALLARYQLKGNPLDLDKAARLLSIAVTHPGNGNHRPDIAFNRLADGFYMNYERSGDSLALMAAIRMFQEVLPFCPESNVQRPAVLSNLALALIEKHERSSDREALEDAIRYNREALDLLRPGNSTRFTTMVNLARCLHRRGEVNADLADLVRASQLCEDVLEDVPTSHSVRVIAFTNLGLCLHRRSQITGDVDLARRAAVVHRQAVDLRQLGDSQRAHSFCNLGLSLTHLYKQTGDLSSLEDAVFALKEAESIVSPSDVHRPTIIANLALSLHYRFEHMGDIDSLSDAIRLNKEVLSIATPSQPVRSWCLLNLTHCFIHQYRESPNHIVSEESLRWAREAVDAHPPKHLNRSMALNNMAVCLDHHRAQTQDKSLLDQIIECYEEALTLRPEGHPRRSASLLNLGLALESRSFETSDISSMERSIQYYEAALDTCPEEHPERLEIHRSLALAHLKQKLPTLSPVLGLEHLLQAITMKSTSARRRLRLIAPHILEWRDKQGDSLRSEQWLSNTLILYKQIIALFPRVAHTGLDLRARLEELAPAEQYGSAAATCALILSQPVTAVELLEEARGIFWAQAILLRSPLDDVTEPERSELAELFQLLEGRGVSVTQDARQLSANRRDEDLVLRRRQSERVEEILQTIRGRPGLERFFLAQPFSALAGIAATSPVVILVAHKNLCHAMVIEHPEGTIKYVQLSDVTDEALRKFCEEGRHAGLRGGEDIEVEQGRPIMKTKPAGKSDKERALLARLWRSVVKPVIETLKLKVYHIRLSHCWSDLH